MPSVTQLKYIVAVADLGHFGKAADACHVSQPSLSIQIQKVEDEIGFTLFDRTTKPITATTKGRVYIENARAVLIAHERLAQIGKAKEAEVSGPFRLGLIPTVGPYLLPLFIESFSKNYPRVELTVDEIKTEVAIDEIKQGRLDAAILSTPLHEQSIIEEPIYYEPFYLYLSSDHPLIGRRRVQQKDLDPGQLWLLEEGHCFKNQVISYCGFDRKGGVYPNVNFQGGNLETIRYLIQKTKGYSLFPYLFIDRLPKSERDKYVKQVGSPTPSREISIVYNKAQWKTDIINALKTSVHEALPKGLKDIQSQRMDVLEF